MSDEKKGLSKFFLDIAANITPENVQKYIFGVKKSGQPRALYDLFMDYAQSSKTKKKDKKKRSKGNPHSLYLKVKKSKKKKKNKYWHI